MIRRSPLLVVAALALAGCATSAAPAAPAPAAAPLSEPERPVPYPVVPSPAFLQAVENGTRTLTGEPGPRYWQNFVEYRLRARVHPADKRLEGSGTIVYHNNSPDTLPVLVMDLAQNLHAPGVPRNESAEVTGGITLKRVTVGGREIPEGTPGEQGPRYVVQGTKMFLVLPSPVLPGARAQLEVDWSFPIPKQGAGARMGWDDDNLLFLAYWYPQMAVYDDLEGWAVDPFLGNAEFYSPFGSYDLTIEAPAQWLVMSTGELLNAEEVLRPEIVERLRRAEGSDDVVHVLTPDDFGSFTQPARDGWLRWRFQADTVRDAAFSVTSESNWDAARTPVGDRDGDGDLDHARVDAIWRPAAARWANVWRYAQHSIAFLSDFTDYPYPWPHMSAVEGSGIIGGGMEYPMMTLIGPYTMAGDDALYNVTAHELAHMWFPMILATNERRHAWIDEGTTTFNENQARMDFRPGEEAEAGDVASYLNLARAGAEGEIMRWSDFHYSGAAYGIASYSKPGTVLATLRGLLGEETFLRAYRQLVDDWAFKHPTPYDMWNTFERVSGRDLDWFWRTWYYETWALDHAIASVETGAGGTTVTVEDEGLAPMPARLRITTAGGETIEREVPVATWLSGARTATVTVPATDVTRVEIDPEGLFPEVDRDDNVWTS